YPYRTASSSDVPFGSGVNTLISYPSRPTTSRRSSGMIATWNRGTVSRLGGPTCMRMAIEDAFAVDLYDSDIDAGDEDGHIEARTSNLQHVVDPITAASAGHAVLVFGNANLRYT
ncbi:hypothetical protein DOTSEDRAFT_100065, partial [Dothistroma septosporum NZE10]